MKCQKCGKEFEGKFCPECGSRSSLAVLQCPVCGTKRKGDDKFCANCGYSYDGAVVADNAAIKIGGTNVKEIFNKIYRYFAAVGILILGIISLLSLASPVMQTSLFGFVESSEIGFKLIAGESLEEPIVINTTITLLAVSLFIILYGIVLLVKSNKTPYSTVKKIPYYVIDGILCCALIILGSIVSVIATKEGCDLGTGYALCISCGVIGLIVLALRAVYEIKFSDFATLKNKNEIDGMRWTITHNNSVAIVNYSGRAKHVFIPKTINGYSVTTIRANVFAWNNSITSIVMGNGITVIDNASFCGCSNLASILLPESIVKIDNFAFSCSGLRSAVIPHGVSQIGKFAFENCKKLNYVVIPKSVTDIGAYAFERCDNLTIYCEATSQPSGWDSKWNPKNRPVIWGYNV